jgi:hypothetical protein
MKNIITGINWRIARLFIRAQIAPWEAQIVAYIAMFVFVFVIVVAVIGFIISGIGSWQIKSLGNDANKAANAQQQLNTNRQLIIQESDKDLKIIREEKRKSNENINNSLINVNAARSSRNGRNVSASELDAAANDYRR